MYFFSYLKFLLSATNQHGVHSPFVYTFVTKCLYHKKKYTHQKSLNVFLKVISYFDISQIEIQNKNKTLTDLIAIHFPKVKENKNTTDFIYFNTIDNELIKFITDKNITHNKNIIFIDALYKNKKAWEELILMKKITVSIDLFYCGILFFRKEQAKEHFKIRI
tara:strand:+ start:9783 stop:10271 length:489 start_codon:yes stop_codon:yes gene_type:complete